VHSFGGVGEDVKKAGNSNRKGARRGGEGCCVQHGAKTDRGTHYDPATALAKTYPAIVVEVEPPKGSWGREETQGESRGAVRGGAQLPPLKNLGLRVGGKKSGDEKSRIPEDSQGTEVFRGFYKGREKKKTWVVQND